MSKNHKYHGLIGLGVLVAAEALMLAGVRPFTTWFYSLAWWAYIMVADQIVWHLTGNSLWVDRRREFLLLIPMSVFFWMLFEGVNYYLQNWHYVGVIDDPWLRWPGYFIAYGTVLPGLFETMELFDALTRGDQGRVRAIPKTTKWYLPFTLVGIFSLYAPLVRPDYFFPLIWGAFTFLLEPVIHARGGRSLMREWEGGSLRTFGLLMAAGLICGLLWEFWNYWAATKWVYTVPHVGFLKIFEMPVLGFLGFPPFAVECYVMANFVGLFRGGRGWPRADAEKPGRTPLPLIMTGVVLFVLVFILAGMTIENHTIRSFL